MTMLAGSVDRTSLNATTGAAGSSSGCAGVIYAWMVSYFAGLASPLPPASTLITVGSTANPFSLARPATSADVTAGLNARTLIYQAWADQANALGQVIAYVLANGHAHVTSQSLGLTPNPNNASTAIQAPASPVDIPLA